MSRNPSGFAKRRREAERKRKRQEKAQRRADRKERKADRDDREGEIEDPDIAGIVPGPQPHPFLDDEEVADGDDEEE